MSENDFLPINQISEFKHLFSDIKMSSGFMEDSNFLYQ